MSPMDFLIDHMQPTISNYSDSDIDVKDGIKLITALLLEINAISYEEKEVENS